MVQVLKLFLPIIIPSWRFFDSIAPSPRIEFTLLETIQETSDNWQEFRPRPAKLSISNMLKRMLWNPRWNESLFLLSCAERLMISPSRKSEEEIEKRIKNELRSCGICSLDKPYFQFRLVFFYREGKNIKNFTPFISKTYRCDRRNDS